MRTFIHRIFVNGLILQYELKAVVEQLDFLDSSVKRRK
jgi:hypothetical protein